MNTWKKHLESLRFKIMRILKWQQACTTKLWGSILFMANFIIYTLVLLYYISYLSFDDLL